MKNYSKHFSAIIVFIILLSLSSLSFGQSKVKKGFKFGPELLTSLSEQTGSFSRSFGFTFGVFTAIRLKSFDDNAILLRTELNFAKFQYYNPGSKRYGVNQYAVGWNGLDYGIFDEKVWFNTIEVCLFPEFQTQLNKNFLLEVFMGPSIGIGGKDYILKQLDNNKFSTDPYDEFGGMGFIFSPTFNLGVSIYYSFFVLDIKYRYTTFFNSGDKNDFNNLYTQLGFSF